MTTTTNHVTSKDGTKIAYDVSGSGPPLVYVMGAMGTREMAFSKAMREELAKSFTLHFYDRRGRGESNDDPAGRYQVAREVEDLRAMVEVAGGNPYVFGTSSGAGLALEAAAAGVPMRKLAAHEPPYAVGTDAASFDRGYRENVTRLVAEGKRAEAVSYFMRTVGVPRPMIWAMRLMPFWKSALAAAPSLPYDAAVMDAFDLPRERLRSIRAPTVVLFGGSTQPRLKTAARAAADAIPGATVREIPKQNHGIQPKALRPVLDEIFPR